MTQFMAVTREKPSKKNCRTGKVTRLGNTKNFLLDKKQLD